MFPEHSSTWTIPILSACVHSRFFIPVIISVTLLWTNRSLSFLCWGLQTGRRTPGWFSWKQRGAKSRGTEDMTQIPQRHIVCQMCKQECLNCDKRNWDPLFKDSQTLKMFPCQGDKLLNQDNSWVMFSGDLGLWKDKVKWGLFSKWTTSWNFSQIVCVSPHIKCTDLHTQIISGKEEDNSGNLG